MSRMFQAALTLLIDNLLHCNVRDQSSYGTKLIIFREGERSVLLNFSLLIKHTRSPSVPLFLDKCDGPPWSSQNVNRSHLRPLTDHYNLLSRKSVGVLRLRYHSYRDDHMRVLMISNQSMTSKHFPKNTAATIVFFLATKIRSVDNVCPFLYAIFRKNTIMRCIENN